MVSISTQHGETRIDLNGCEQYVNPAHEQLVGHPLYGPLGHYICWRLRLWAYMDEHARYVSGGLFQIHIVTQNLDQIMVLLKQSHVYVELNAHTSHVSLLWAIFLV